MRRYRWAYAALAYVFVALALIGVVVPGLPTTIFVILAAWAASRGSDRLHDWLYGHPRFGPALTDWRDRGAVSVRGKVLAVTFLTLSWLLLAWRGTAEWLLALLALLFITVAAFLLTRPS